MRLYRHPLSACSRRAVLTVLELDLASRVELVAVDLAKGAQRLPAHLALNPNGRVPVLDDDGFVLWESHAIMAYLCDQTPGQTLLPTDPRGRADVLRWMFWNTHHLSIGVSTLRRERVVKKILGQGDPDPVEVARGEGLVRQFGAILDDHLATRTWIAGERLSLADLSIASELTAWGPASLPLDDCRHVKAWLDRIASRPSWAASAR